MKSLRRRKPSRRVRFESLEKRQLLAGDVIGGTDEQAALVGLPSIGSQQLQLTSAAQGEEAGIAQRFTALPPILGFQRILDEEIPGFDVLDNRALSVNFEKSSDTLFMHSNLTPFVPILFVEVEGEDESGDTLFTTLQLGPDDLTSTPVIAPAGVQSIQISPVLGLSDNSLIQKKWTERFNQGRANRIFGLTATASLESLAFAVGAGGTGFAGLAANILGKDLTDPSIEADIPSVIHVNQKVAIPFQLTPGLTETRGRITSVTFSLEERGGTSLESIARDSIAIPEGTDEAIVELIIPEGIQVSNNGEVHSLVVTQTFADESTNQLIADVRLFPEVDLDGEFLSENGLFSVDAFDLVAIDELTRREGGVTNGAEVRFGVIEGQVSSQALVDDVSQSFLSDLRLRFRPSVDTIADSSVIDEDIYDIEVRTDSAGRFNLNLESQLLDKDGIAHQILSPRLTANGLTVELLRTKQLGSSLREVVDRLEFPKEVLTQLINRGSLPSNDEFPRVLDVDLSVDNEILDLDENSVFTEVSVYNVDLLEKVTDDDRVLLQWDFGDGSEPVIRNIPTREFRSSARAQSRPEFFGESGIRGLTNIHGEDHAYDEPGEYEITVTATFAGQVSIARKTVVVEDQSDASFEVDQVEITSEFVQIGQSRAIVEGRLIGFEGRNEDFQVELLFEGTAVDANRIEITERGGGVSFKAEVDGLNVLRLGADGEQIILTAVFSDSAFSTVETRVPVRIQKPDLFTAGITRNPFVPTASDLIVNVDTGLAPGQELVVEAKNIPIEFNLFSSDTGTETITTNVNIIEEADGHIVRGLDRLALEAHFGGEDNVPRSNRISNFSFRDTNDSVEIEVRLRNDAPEGTPPAQLKGGLVDRQSFTARKLLGPFVDFLAGPGTGLLELRDGEVDFLVEGVEFASLLDGAQGHNGFGLFELSSPDNAFSFQNGQDLNSDTTVARPGSSVSISPRRSGEGTIRFALPGDNVFMEVTTQIASDRPEAVLSRLDNLESIVPGPLSTEEQRTVNLAFLRGEISNGFLDPVLRKINELQDEGKNTITTIQGNGSIQTSAIHEVTVDWGDGSFPEIFTVNSLLGQQGDVEVTEISHTYEPDVLFRMGRTATNAAGQVEIFVTVNEVDDDGNIVKQGRRQSFTIDGVDLMGIDVGEPLLDADVDDSFTEQFPPFGGVNTPPRKLTQIEKGVVGKGLENFSITPRLGFSDPANYDLTLDLGDGRVFRIQRDNDDRGFGAIFARLFRNAEASGDPELIRVNATGKQIFLRSFETDEPVITYDEIGKYEIRVTQAEGVTFEGSDFTTEQQFARAEIVILPNVNVEVNGDGSLSGTIDAPLGSKTDNGEARLVISAIDSPTGVQPIEVDLSDTTGIELDQTFGRDFQVPGRRLRVDAFFQEVVDGQVLQRVSSRVVTPNPKQELQEIGIAVEGGRFQGSPLNVTLTLAEETTQVAVDATDENPFRLAVSPGGGETDFVLVRDSSTADNEFRIEGTDDSVTFDSASRTIQLRGNQLDVELIKYDRFGTHTLRVFSECSFGSADLTIRDVLPAVAIEQVTVDPFGNLRGTARSTKVGKLKVGSGENPSEQRIDQENELIEFLVNVPDSEFGENGEIQVGFQEDEIDGNGATVTQTVTPEKVKTNIGVSGKFDEGSATVVLQFDIDALAEAMRGRLSEDTKFVSTELNVKVTAADGSVRNFDASVIVVDGSEKPFFVFESHQYDLNEGVRISSFVDGSLDVEIQGVGIDCVEGSGTIDIDELVGAQEVFDAIADFNAVIGPNGETSVTGVLPIGVEGRPVSFSLLGNIVHTIDDPQSAQSFDFSLVAAGPGDEITSSVDGKAATSTTVKQKTSDSDHHIPIEFRNDKKVFEGIDVFLDLSDLIDSLSNRISNDATDSVKFTANADGSLSTFTLAVSKSEAGKVSAVLLNSENQVQSNFDAETGEFELTGFFEFNFSESAFEVTISDPTKCIHGQAKFLRGDSVSAPVQRIAENKDQVDIKAEFTRLRNSNAGSGETAVTVTGRGGTVSDGTNNTASDPLTFTLSDNGEQELDLNFTRDPVQTGVPTQVVFTLDPQDGSIPIELTTDIFVIEVAAPEPCEDHPLFPTGRAFAGNVTMEFSSGDLTLTGDAENNGIAILADERGVVVQPIDGTTLNGLTEAIVLAAGVTLLDGNLTVTSMGDGDDLICMSDLQISGDTDITSTPGDDVLIASNIDFGSTFVIDMGADNDVVDLSGSRSATTIQVSLGDGDDLFNGSESSDSVSGGTGIDTVNGAGGDDRITGDAGADIQRGGAGSDVFIWNNGDGPDDNFGGEDFDFFVFFGADGANDTIRLAPADDVGEAGDGTHPSAEFDLTRTTPSAFTIELSEIEATQVSGLAGDDIIDASAIPEGLLTTVALGGNAGNDRLLGSQGVDGLAGGGGNDTIIGNRGNDFGFGESTEGFEDDTPAGDDLFIWNNGDGADNFFGDEGNDTFQFNGADGADDEIVITPGSNVGEFEADSDFGASTDLTRTAPSAFTIETLQIENFEVSGLAGNDIIDASNVPFGLLNSLTLNGNQGDDQLTGSALDDVLNGNEGNDTITGFLGADQQFGGLGDDLFVWNNGDGPDDNFGGEGDDTFRFNGADGADDQLRLALAADVGAGGDGTHPSADFDLTRVLPSAFTIENGGIENAEINGLGGNDEIDVSALEAETLVNLKLGGGAGDDEFVVSDAAEQVFDGGEGNDKVSLNAADQAFDFTQLVDEALKDINEIDINGTGANQISLNPAEVRRVISDDADLTIRAGEGDQFDLGEGWTRETSEVVDNVFQQVFTNEATTLRVESARAFQNPVVPGDVNGDNQLTPFDALIILNRLKQRRQAFFELPDRRDDLDDDLSDLQFFDVSGDGNLSLFDALLVLNELAKQRNLVRGEQVPSQVTNTLSGSRSLSTDREMDESQIQRSLF